MQTQIENIFIRNFPFWLYPTEVMHDAIQDGESEISFFHNIEIPNSDNIDNLEDFIKVAKCCEYFRYDAGGLKHPLSLYAYYFLNYEEVREYCHENLSSLYNFLEEEEDNYRNSSLLYYANKRGILFGSAEWDLKIYPAIDLITGEKMDHSIEINGLNVKEECFFNDEKMERYGIYLLFFDEFESLFYGFDYFLKSMQFNRKTSYSGIHPFSKIITTFVSFYNLRQELGINNKYRRFALYTIVKGTDFLFEEYHNNVFHKVLEFMKSFIQCCEDNNFDSFSSEEYENIKNYASDLVSENKAIIENFKAFFSFSYNCDKSVKRFLDAV